MGVEIVAHQAHLFGSGIVSIKQRLDLVRPIYAGALARTSTVRYPRTGSVKRNTFVVPPRSYP
jgi:hypothetical protein